MQKNSKKKIIRRVSNKDFAARLTKYSEVLTKIIGDYDRGVTVAIQERTPLNEDSEDFLFHWARRELSEKHTRVLARRRNTLRELKGELHHILETSFHLTSEEISEMAEHREIHDPL